MVFRLIVRVPLLNTEFSWRQVIAASRIFAKRCQIVTKSGPIPNVAGAPWEWIVSFHGPHGMWYVIADKTGSAISAPDTNDVTYEELYVSLYRCVSGCREPATCHHPDNLRGSAHKLSIGFARCLLEIAAS